ncbi:MAG TPA: hypothetical protein VG518_01470 [Solirubrobacterales bacterium]|nr:hypothetical protein [Solirubrobacterales bacterium]
MGIPLDSLLGVLPAVLLALALLCGRYPGESIVVRLAGRRRAPRRSPVPEPARRYSGPSITRQRLLLASSRSLRGPPSPSYA